MGPDLARARNFSCSSKKRALPVLGMAADASTFCDTCAEAAGAGAARLRDGQGQPRGQGRGEEGVFSWTMEKRTSLLSSRA